MKQIFIIFFFLQMGLVMLAQPTIVITGCPSGCNTCVEPSTALSYNATVTLQQNDTFVDIEWIKVGGSGASNTDTFDIEESSLELSIGLLAWLAVKELEN